MIEVLNAGSGATSASRDKFPRAILPRTFDYGFATGLMVKDVRLYLDEAKALGVPVEVAEAIGRLWEAAARDQGPDSDFTAVIKPLREAPPASPWAAGDRPEQHAGFRRMQPVHVGDEVCRTAAENDIIQIEERHLPAYLQYRRLPGQMTNRNAYRKSIDWQPKRMLDCLSYDRAELISGPATRLPRVRRMAFVIEHADGTRTPADRRERAHLLPVQQGPALLPARAVQEPRFPRLRDGLVRRPGRRIRAQRRGAGPASTRVRTRNSLPTNCFRSAASTSRYCTRWAAASCRTGTWAARCTPPTTR